MHSVSNLPSDSTLKNSKKTVLLCQYQDFLCFHTFSASSRHDGSPVKIDSRCQALSGIAAQIPLHFIRFAGGYALFRMCPKFASRQVVDRQAHPQRRARPVVLQEETGRLTRRTARAAHRQQTGLHGFQSAFPVGRTDQLNRNKKNKDATDLGC